MAKKSKLKHPTGHFNKDYLLLNFCKWEFLRRNKKYQRDYERWIRKPGGSPSLKAIDYFQKKWELSYPADYKESLKLKEVLNLSNPNEFAYAKIPNFLPISEFVECLTPEKIFSDGRVLGGGRIKYISQEKLAKVSTIILKVNLKAHKKELFKEIDEIITKWQDRKKKYGELIVLRKRVGDWKKYLKVYDYKAQNPEATLKTIAKKTLKIEEPLRSDEDKIYKMLKKCKELIDGDYAKII